jgi:hypothetical protein
MKSQGNEPAADTIFFGGDIVTVDENNPTVEALAVGGEIIRAVGTRGEVFDLKGPNTEMVDLAGKTLTPGLI